MITLHESIEVNRPVHEAFAYVADFRTSREWDSTVKSATKLSDGPIAAGTRFKVVCRQPLGSITLVYTLTRLVAGKSIVLNGKGSLFDIEDTISFTETATGTRIDYRASFTFKWPLSRLEKHMLPGLQRMGVASVQQGLKSALEDNFPRPVSTPGNRRAEKLLLPAIAQFTRYGYKKASQHWSPMSAWMGDKHVVITGASSGLGLASALRLAELGAELTLVIRNESRACALRDNILEQTGNAKIHIEIADLSLMADVDALVTRMLAKAKPVDVLINNAGALYNPRELTSEGLERSFALLLLSPYRLTTGIKPLLDQSHGARVINVVSGGMYSQRLNLGKLEAPEEDYAGSAAYAHAKRALMIVTQQWANEWAGDGIVVNAMHPGWAETPGVETALPTFHRITRPLLRTPEQGADTIVWLAVATEAGALNGQLLLDREPRTAHLKASTREPAAERKHLMAILADYPCPGLSCGARLSA